MSFLVGGSSFFKGACVSSFCLLGVGGRFFFFFLEGGRSSVKRNQENKEARVFVFLFLLLCSAVPCRPFFMASIAGEKRPWAEHIAQFIK